MTVTRPRAFVPGTFLKNCSICGFGYYANELRRGEDGFWRCVAYCVEVPSITRDKIATMSSKRKEAPPPPHGTPFDRASTYANEAIVFNFLCETQFKDAAWPGGFRNGAAPWPYFDTTNGGVGAMANDPMTATYNAGSPGYSVMAAAETCRYLYNLINDNLRPLRWISVAKTKLRELVDWLITKQRGFGTAPTSTKTNDAFYGGIIEQNPAFQLYFAAQNAGAGLAMLYAYRALGDAKYLVSAKASATYLRNAQALPTYVGATYTGSLYEYAAPGPSVSSTFYPTALIALEFWNELLTTSGDAQYGSDGTPTPFTAIPQQLLSQSITDIRTFWRVGALNTNGGGIITGLSATTPCEFYQSGGWQRLNGTYPGGSLITSQYFAIALRSLHAYEGYSTQVASVWTYLMSLGSSSVYKSAANTLATDYTCAIGTNSANPPAPPDGQGNVIAPSFDPKLALSTNTDVSAATNGMDRQWYIVTGGSINLDRCTYDWTTAGLMAAIQSSRDQGSFKKAKIALTTTRYRMPTTFVDLPVEETIMLRGSSGLAFQLSQYDDTTAGGDPNYRLISTVAAAMIGNVFRYQPQSYTGSAAPGQPYSQKPPGVQA